MMFCLSQITVACASSQVSPFLRFARFSVECPYVSHRIAGCPHAMKMLITAGGTRAYVDPVRCFSTIFTGKTGATVATTAWNRGHTVSFLTSNPDQLPEIPDQSTLSERRFQTTVYSSFDDLTMLLQKHVRSGEYDVIIHTASIAEYLVAGAYTPDAGTQFQSRSQTWEAPGVPKFVERKPGQLDGTEAEVWVRLMRAPRLIDRFRPQWGFRGTLVVFKTLSGRNDAELIAAADEARGNNFADLIAANTAESSKHWAILGPVDGRFERVARRELPERLLLTIEHMRQTGKGSWHDG